MDNIVLLIAFGLIYFMILDPAEATTKKKSMLDSTS